MSNLLKLPSRGDGGVHVVVETPRGSHDKLKLDPELKAIVVSRPLTAGLVYPHDWGFVPSTLAEDGDPIDAMVVSDHAHPPGVVIPSRAIGVVLVTQKAEQGKGRERNDRLIFVPTRMALYEDARQIPKHVQKELERFFELAVVTEDKELELEGWDGPKAAEELLREAER